jgi:cellulose synthase/poly-beta-1,6-N-acetylglucosamine synthase-like glycosyltransferase
MEIVSVIRWPLLATYFGILVLLAGYGLHRWYLLGLYLKLRKNRPSPGPEPQNLPVLTIQLPVFNERYVVERLIDAVCAIDYPRELLEIQVLDDSTDDTVEISRKAVENKRQEGFRITHLHRSDRSGFKAGALEAGLQVAEGELVAVFDADFVPRPDFARRLLPHFNDPTVGMVQARWGHLNRNFSALTHVQSMFLDGHFVIEHTARNRSGRFFNFNGTAGIWRRACIREAGGWQHDTLTEDLDLSYRAQMKGWRFVYVPEYTVPAELPVEMSAFKSQQHRWAKGSIQTGRKLLPEILRSTLPLKVKLEALFHLTANMGYVLVLALALLVVPSIWLRAGIPGWPFLWLDVPLFCLSSLSVAMFYLFAHREALGTWRGIVRWIPFLMAVGIGLSINNARAVLEALLGQVSEFRRTPKYNLKKGESSTARTYRIRVNTDTWVETMLALYFTAAMLATGVAGLWIPMPFLLLFAGGYTYVAGTNLLQTWKAART